MPSQLDENVRAFIDRRISEQTRYMVPRKAYAVYVYEHTSPSDPWNHEVDVRLKGNVPGDPREYEVPAMTPVPGATMLPNDVDRNYSLSKHPSDPDFNDEGKQPTEKSDGEKPGNKPKDVDDRPECLIEYVDGDPDSPVITGWFYSDENRTPIGRVNDVRFTVGLWVMEVRTTEDGEQYAQMGITEQPGGPVKRGFVIPPSGNPKILGSGGTDILAEAASDGSGGGAGDGSGVLPDTDPTAPPAERASQAGIDIQNTVTVSSSIDEIDGADHTLYIVDGVALDHAGKHGLGDVNHVAICGKNGASLKIPSGFRDYSMTTSGGTNFMWSGIDLDQSASGAYGRLNFNIANGGFYESFQTIGSGRHPDADPASSYPGVSNGQAQLHIPATSSSGTVRMKNVSLIQGGLNPNTHEKSYPIGIQFTKNDHKGTLNIIDSQIEEFPNNAIYASACPGTVNATNTRLYNNAVAQYRASSGLVKNCTIGYDANNNGMANADSQGHGIVGIASEQKKGGRGGSVSVQGGTVEWKNVAKTRGAIATYDIHGTGHFDSIEGVEVIVDKGTGGAAHIHIGGQCKGIKNVTFGGSVSSGVCVVNKGPPINTSGLTNNTSRGLGV